MWVGMISQIHTVEVFVVKFLSTNSKSRTYRAGHPVGMWEKSERKRVQSNFDLAKKGPRGTFPAIAALDERTDAVRAAAAATEAAWEAREERIATAERTSERS